MQKKNYLYLAMDVLTSPLYIVIAYILISILFPILGIAPSKNTNGSMAVNKHLLNAYSIWTVIILIGCGALFYKLLSKQYLDFCLLKLYRITLLRAPLLVYFVCAFFIIMLFGIAGNADPETLTMATVSQTLPTLTRLENTIHHALISYGILGWAIFCNIFTYFLYLKHKKQTTLKNNKPLQSV